MVGIGEYWESTNVSSYKLNTSYNSIIRYYEDLIKGKLTHGSIPYDVIITERIISCKFKYLDKLEVRVVASIKNKIHDTESRKENF